MCVCVYVTANERGHKKLTVRGAELGIHGGGAAVVGSLEHGAVSKDLAATLLTTGSRGTLAGDGGEEGDHVSINTVARARRVLDGQVVGCVDWDIGAPVEGTAGPGGLQTDGDVFGQPLVIGEALLVGGWHHVHGPQILEGGRVLGDRLRSGNRSHLEVLCGGLDGLLWMR